MSVLRSLLIAALTGLAAAACSSPAPAGGPDAGYCESNGYSTPTGSACPKGTCMASGTPTACCGSECASCEAKGLVSYGSNAMCPAGLCPSADVTATLLCCDTCGPIGAEAGPDAGADVVEAAVEASGNHDASGD